MDKENIPKVHNSQDIKNSAKPLVSKCKQLYDCVSREISSTHRQIRIHRVCTSSNTAHHNSSSLPNKNLPDISGSTVSCYISLLSVYLRESSVSAMSFLVCLSYSWMASSWGWSNPKWQVYFHMALTHVSQTFKFIPVVGEKRSLLCQALICMRLRNVTESHLCFLFCDWFIPFAHLYQLAFFFF